MVVVVKKACENLGADTVQGLVEPCDVVTTRLLLVGVDNLMIVGDWSNPTPAGHLREKNQRIIIKTNNILTRSSLMALLSMKFCAHSQQSLLIAPHFCANREAKVAYFVKCTRSSSLLT